MKKVVIPKDTNTGYPKIMEKYGSTKYILSKYSSVVEDTIKCIIDKFSCEDSSPIELVKQDLQDDLLNLAEYYLQRDTLDVSLKKYLSIGLKLIAIKKIYLIDSMSHMDTHELQEIALLHNLRKKYPDMSEREIIEKFRDLKLKYFDKKIMEQSDKHKKASSVSGEEDEKDTSVKKHNDSIYNTVKEKAEYNAKDAKYWYDKATEIDDYTTFKTKNKIVEYNPDSTLSKRLHIFNNEHLQSELKQEFSKITPIQIESMLEYLDNLSIFKNIPLQVEDIMVELSMSQEKKLFEILLSEITFKN